MSTSRSTQAAAPPEAASNWERDWTQRFAHGMFDWALENRVTARELAMLRVMNSITDRPGWETGVFNDEVAASWKVEVVGGAGEWLISAKAWDWCLRELRDKAAGLARNGLVMVYDVGPGVSKSQPGIGRGLKTMVRDIVAGTDQSDWRLHVHDDGCVLNIIDPSLYPLAYGITKVLPSGEGEVDLECVWDRIGRGQRSVVAPHALEDIFRRSGIDPERAPEILRAPLRERQEEPGRFFPYYDARWSEDKPWRYSNRFQWLPCDVKFSDPDADDCKVRIESYVNNLHPARHRPLYSAIEDVISASVQPWNTTVTYAVPPARSRKIPLGPTVGLGRANPRIRMFDLAEGVPVSPKGICWNEEGNFFRELQGLSDAWDTLAPATRNAALQDVIARMERAEHVLVGGADPLGMDRLQYCREIRDSLAPFLHPDAGVLFSYPDWKSGVVPPKTIRSEYRVPPCESSEDEDEAQPDGFEWPSPGASPAFDERLRTCQHCPCWHLPAKLLRLSRGKHARDLEASRTLDQYDHDYRHAQIQRDFRSQGLQVYVRVQSIELEPGHPPARYGGSDWMLEGLLNERIIASSVYFFDVENVKADSASLAFRVQTGLTSESFAGPGSEARQSLISLFAVDELVASGLPTTYEDLIPYDDDIIDEFPVPDERPADDYLIPHLQELGVVSASEGKLVAFPNTLQYRMGPVELRDSSMPGHVRFLTLCLADPNYRLVSTKRVVPQRFDWWIQDVFPLAYLASRGLPPELVYQIAEEARDQAITPDEARELWCRASRERERMMAELNSNTYALAFPNGAVAE